MTIALIVTDMLNPYDHPDADPLMQSARSVVPAIAELVRHAREHDVLIAYVNDHHDDWTAGRRELIQRALDGKAPELVEPIVPPADAPFIVKARHSIFYGTQVEYMLRRFEVSRLVLAGQVTEQCILYSALDAYIRHFDMLVPRDAVAHIHEDLADAALRMMELNMHTEVVEADEALSTLGG